MADATYASISSALATLFQPEVVPQFQRACVLSQLLPYEPAAAKNVQWDINTGSTPVDLTLGDGTNVSSFDNDTLTPAALNLGSYSEAFSVTLFAQAAAARVNNPTELAALYGHKLMGAVTRLAKNLNGELYSGDGSTNHILGLVDPTAGGIISTGTYATVDRGSITQFAGNELGNGGNARPLDPDLMRDARRTIYTACGEMPDLIVCDPFQFEQYGKTFGQHRRYLPDVTIRGQKIFLDAGYKALEFDGIPVFMDADCPAGKMLFLNTKYIKIRQMPIPAPQPGDPNAHGVINLHGTSEEQLGDGPLGMQVGIQELARTGTMRKFQLYMWPQLQVERPNANCLLKDLATS